MINLAGQSNIFLILIIALVMGFKFYISMKNESKKKITDENFPIPGDENTLEPYNQELDSEEYSTQAEEEQIETVEPVISDFDKIHHRAEVESKLEEYYRQNANSKKQNKQNVSKIRDNSKKMAQETSKKEEELDNIGNFALESNDDLKKAIIWSEVINKKY